MTFSSELLEKSANTLGAVEDLGFEVIVAFGYYDGPESGLAIYPTGDGFRFSSLGDSKSRFFRSFELVPIEGTWWSQFKALPQAQGFVRTSRIFLPSASSEELIHLKSDVFRARSTGQFVGVGTPYFERVSVSAVNDRDLSELHELSGSPNGFRKAHQLIKLKSKLFST
jgi:hypothetical protein